MLNVVALVRETVLRHGTARQLVKFGFVGTFNTLLDFSVYVFLTRLFAFWGEHLVAATVLSYCCGMVSSFTLNNFWTFRQDRQGITKRMPKFLVVTLAGMVWNAGILHALVTLGVYDLIAKAFATGCVIGWNFLLYKKWAFKA